MKNEGGAVKFLGNTDEVTTCDCCGRQGLKSTVALSINEGDAVYYGVVCAGRALAMPAADVRKAAKSADDAREAEVARARAARHDAEMSEWKAFLDARVPQFSGLGNVFRQLEVLGGFRIARDLFNASR